MTFTSHMGSEEVRLEDLPTRLQSVRNACRQHIDNRLQSRCLLIEDTPE
jgi:hypothetical protein